MEPTTAPAPINPKVNHPKFVRWAIVIGLIIVLNIFFLVVRSLALPEPQFADFCPAAAKGVVANDAQSCGAQGGTWNDYGTSPAPTASMAPATGYCDFYATCQPAYDKTMQQYDLYAFSLLIVLGLISIALGVFVPLGSSIVSTGLSYGGVVAFIIAAASYWSEAGNWVRLLISLIALAALLYIGIKRFKD